MTTYRPVLSKRDFVERYSRGEFGNAAPTWNGFVEWCTDHLGGDKLQKFHIRNRVAGAMTWYNVCKYEMADRWAIACKHFPPEQLYISAMAPTELTLIQGEVMQSEVGSIELFYSTVKKPMREALALGAVRQRGIIAVSLLKHFMCANSYEWLQILLDRYPNHVVEFSTYDRNWGTLPNFNSVFWEVRRY